MKKTKLIKTVGALALAGAMMLGTSHCDKSEIPEIEEEEETQPQPQGNDSITIVPFNKDGNTMQDF